MDLSTQYLGFDLPNPLVVGASPLGDDLDTVRRLEDAGAAMIVLRSLFAEQIDYDRGATKDEFFTDSVLAAHRMRSTGDDFVLRPQAYVEHLRQVRHAVRETLPIVASLNVARLGGWLEYVRLIDEAGASALELNIYTFNADADRSADTIESELAEMVRAVSGQTMMPIAVKLMPFYTSLAHLAHRLVDAGAKALVLFNRLYQPDIDTEAQNEQPVVRLSSSHELLMRLRWLGMLYGRVNVDLALTGGVDSSEHAIKAIMCGAQAVQVVSALLRHGPDHLRVLREGVEQWLESHGHQRLADIRGSVSLRDFPNPQAFERGFYMHMLQTWQP